MTVTVELLRNTPHGNMWDTVVVENDDFIAYWPEYMKKVSESTDKAMDDIKNTSMQGKGKKK